MNAYSVIIPAFNEEASVADTVHLLMQEFATFGRTAEVIVVDDGSTDATGTHATSAGATVIRNPLNAGYGASLKRGLAAAAHPHIVIIDADGTYPASGLPALLSEYEKGYDMVVGQRTGSEYRRGLLKYPARLIFTAIAEFSVGRRIPDINSGFRVFRKAITERFREDLCDGFSFTTTITLLSMLQGYFVTYVPIHYGVRLGLSKVRHVRDSLRVMQIIVRAILLYNPVKLFLLLTGAGILAGLVAMLIGALGHRWSAGALAAAVFFASALVTFGIGLHADIMAMLRQHFIGADKKEKE